MPIAGSFQAAYDPNQLQEILQSNLQTKAMKQQLQSQAIRDAITQQLAPLQIARQKQLIDQSERQASLGDALDKLKLMQAGVFVSPQRAGMPESVPALPLDLGQINAVASSDKPSLAAGVPKTTSDLAPSVTSPTIFTNPTDLGGGAVFDPQTSQNNIYNAFRQKMNEKQQESDIIQGRETAVARAKEQEKQKAPDAKAFEKTIKILDDFNKQDPVKRFAEVASNWNNVQAAVKQAQTADQKFAADNLLADQSLKMANPKAVVRVGALNFLKKGTTTWQNLVRKAQTVFEGGGSFTPEERQALLDVDQRIYQNDLKDYIQTRKDYKKRAVDFGLDPQKTLPSFVPEFKTETLARQHGLEDGDRAIIGGVPGTLGPEE